MITAWRLCSSRYPANSGEGARLYGGRWNRVGCPAIYAAAHASLAALEVIVHYAELPEAFVLTEIQIPDALLAYSDNALPEGWNGPHYNAATQDRLADFFYLPDNPPAIRVPSAIIPSEWNYVINPRHPEFHQIEFLPSQPFHFDPRLK